MENKFSGMTINERLYVCGLIDEFYCAIEEKDVDTLVELLKKVDLKNELIDEILESKGLKSTK